MAPELSVFVSMAPALELCFFITWLRIQLWSCVFYNIAPGPALRQFTQWPWIEHSTFQLGGGHLTTELLLNH